jgi:two-component system chemotaxis sensor kinase CheA
VSPEAVIDTGQGQSIVVDDTSVRLSTLGRWVHPAHREGALAASTSAFVIESDGRAVAFTVDRVLGTANVVMRSLPALAPAMSWIVGASLDVGGIARLVLDPASLIVEAEHAQAVYPEREVVRHSILIVDDSLTTRMLEQSILESAGYDVSVASSGEEGLEKARHGRFGLVLVDVEMPGMDGFTFIEQVRADPALRTTPCILVTSRASAEDRQRGREVGAQGYVVKGDFDQSALLEQIGTLVQ